MEIKFSPNNGELIGTVSFLSWNDPVLHEAIRQAFGQSAREEIAEVWIERDGIKARFEFK